MWRYHYDVLLRGEYQEYDTILWLRDTIRAGDCVLDIGANVGQMTLEAALLVGAAGRVIAIEPAPGNLALLQAHVEANGFADRVEVVPAACCAVHGGQAVLQIIGIAPSAIGSGHNLGSRSDFHGPQCRLSVPAVSIDGLCRERNLSPAVIKIDVEGAEIEVLRGAVETLRRCRPQLRFGFHPFAFSDPRAATAEIRELLTACEYASSTPGPAATYSLEEYDAKPKLLA
jgi:FkbM family methyltransferase